MLAICIRRDRSSHPRFFFLRIPMGTINSGPRKYSKTYGNFFTNPRILCSLWKPLVIVIITIMVAWFCAPVILVCTSENGALEVKDHLLYYGIILGKI